MCARCPVRAVTAERHARVAPLDRVFHQVGPFEFLDTSASMQRDIMSPIDPAGHGEEKQLKREGGGRHRPIVGALNSPARTRLQPDPVFVQDGAPELVQRRPDITMELVADAANEPWFLPERSSGAIIGRDAPFLYVRGFRDETVAST